MRKPVFIAGTWALFVLAVWAFVNVVHAALRQSTQGTDSGTVLFIATVVVFLVWLSLFASGWLSIYAKGAILKVLARRNLIFSIVALLACFPLAFLFVGFVLPPVILFVSSLWLTYALMNDYPASQAAPDASNAL